MKEVLIKTIGGGIIRILANQSQVESLQSGSGIHTDMYGNIPGHLIQSWKFV